MPRREPRNVRKEAESERVRVREWMRNKIYCAKESENGREIGGRRSSLFRSRLTVEARHV